MPGSWVFLPSHYAESQTGHSERSGPIPSSAPLCGASGRVERNLSWVLSPDSAHLSMLVAQSLLTVLLGFSSLRTSASSAPPRYLYLFSLPRHDPSSERALGANDRTPRVLPPNHRSPAAFTLTLLYSFTLTLPLLSSSGPANSSDTPRIYILLTMFHPCVTLLLSVNFSFS